MNQIINTLNYDLNRMSAMDLISVIHIDDFNTRFIKLSLSDRGSPFSVAGSTVIARFVTVNGVLLNDNVSCTVTEDGKILIPIDAAAVNSVACDLKIEVNITQGTDVLTLPFPLWVRVRGSILETSGISPESQGTIPDLLHQVQEELQRVQGFTDEDEVYEILDNTLSGNRNISPTLLVDRVTDQTYNPNGDLILYYIDSDDVRHNIFNFSPYLGTRNYNALQNRPVIRGRDVSSNVNTALEGYLNFGSDGFTVSTYQGPDKEIDVELSRSVPNCKTASNDWAGYYDFNNLAGIYAGAGVFRVSANKALNKPAALANIVGDLCITHLATIADGATLIRYVTGVNVDGDILNYLQKATLEKRTALSYDVVSQSAWQEVAVTKMLDTALSGNNPNSAMTLNLDNIVDQAANPYGHLMLYYIDSDWTRHNIFDFTRDLSLRGDQIFPGTIDWYRLDDLAQASIFRDYGRKGYPEPDLMTNPSKLFMNGVCYIDDTTLTGLPVAQAGYWIKIHSAYTPSGTSWTNYIEFYIAESSDRVFLRHIFQGQYTSWQEIGVKVSSAAVNQNGTITLTMSDGSTVTTTGQNVVTSGNEKISMGYDSGGFYFIFDDGQGV